jgi:myo-inositol-1(or 4)-monophosphatase
MPMHNPPGPEVGGGGAAVEDAEVEELLREVGAFQLEGYRSLEAAGVQVKDADGGRPSVVTRYDVETERRVHEFLARRSPGDSFLGEELGNVRRDPRRYWILDPIDGTTNFTQRIPFWGPSLALLDAGGIARGWIHFPALGEMYRAARGGGAFRNGRPIRTSSVREYSDLCTVATVSRSHRRFRLSCPAKHRILGSVVVNLAYLAAGTFAASYCRASIWDIAAGILIAKEAGAAIETDPPIESIDPAAIEPGRSPSISVWATANRDLPPFRRYLHPLPGSGPKPTT